jgi:hypothetical protein
MTAQIILLEDVVVTGTAGAVEARKVPFEVGQVTASDIQVPHEQRRRRDPGQGGGRHRRVRLGPARLRSVHPAARAEEHQRRGPQPGAALHRGRRDPRRQRGGHRRPRRGEDRGAEGRRRRLAVRLARRQRRHQHHDAPRQPHPGRSGPLLVPLRVRPRRAAADALVAAHADAPVRADGGRPVRGPLGEPVRLHDLPQPAPRGPAGCDPPRPRTTSTPSRRRRGLGRPTIRSRGCSARARTGRTRSRPRGGRAPRTSTCRSTTFATRAS